MSQHRERSSILTGRKVLTLRGGPVTLGLLPKTGKGARMRRVGTPQHWTSQLASSIRRFLSWIFALTAFICLRLSVLTLPHMLHPPQPVPRVGLRIAGAAFGLALPIQGVVFAMAWWTVWRRKRSARGWALAASLFFMLQGGLVLFTESPAASSFMECNFARYRRCGAHRILTP